MFRTSFLLSSALAVGQLACSSGNSAPTGTQNSGIVGGQIEAGYGAVGALIDDSGPFCTGTLVSPTVVVTAAHCLEELDGPRAVQFFLGGDANRPASGTVLPVAQFAMHPDYPRDEDADIGVMRLAQPAQVAPIALNTDALGAELVGRQATFVGFGTVGYANPDDDGAGVKRSTSVTLRQIDPKSFEYSDAGRGTCHGDSGGPALLAIGGVQRLIGVVSWGDEDCEQFGVNTRTDTFAAFLRAFVDGAPGDRPGEDEPGEDEPGEHEPGEHEPGDEECACDDDADDWDEDEAWGGDDEPCDEGHDDAGHDDQGWEDEGQDDEGWEDEGFDDACEAELDDCLAGADSEPAIDACFDEADACYDE